MNINRTFGFFGSLDFDFLIFNFFLKICFGVLDGLLVLEGHVIVICLRQFHFHVRYFLVRIGSLKISFREFARDQIIGIYFVSGESFDNFFWFFSHDIGNLKKLVFLSFSLLLENFPNLKFRFQAVQNSLLQIPSVIHQHVGILFFPRLLSDIQNLTILSNSRHILLLIFDILIEHFLPIAFLYFVLRKLRYLFWSRKISSFNFLHVRHLYYVVNSRSFTHF